MKLKPYTRTFYREQEIETYLRVPFVAWNQVCKPKSNRSLGLRDTTAWNINLTAKRTWQVDMNKDNFGGLNGYIYKHYLNN